LTPQRQPPRTPSYSNAAPAASFDSATASCRHNPSACLAAVGKEVASAAAVVKLALDEDTRKSVEEALTRCADSARSEILLRHEGDFKDLTPTADECNQPAKNATRKDVTWAMQLGTEMHEEARNCAEAALSTLLPGRFSLEQRYQYNRQTGRRRLVSAEEERLLEETGNAGELLGSLKPDVVIHSGNPLDVKAVYDFKFPCVNIDTAPDWNKYPPGHPYQGSNQGAMYHEAFGEAPVRIVPRLGVIR
jgi:rRNA maturation protein Nop10